jgi:hypothetical protein
MALLGYCGALYSGLDLDKLISLFGEDHVVNICPHLR